MSPPPTSASPSSSTRVLREVWPWRETPESVPPPAGSPVRKRVVLQMVIMSGAGAALAYGWDHLLAGRVVWGLAAGIGMLGLTAPSAFHALERGLKRFGGWVGLALTWVLLVPFYYLSFVPARCGLLLTRADPLGRRANPSGGTYWESRPPVRSVERYRKQY